MPLREKKPPATKDSSESHDSELRYLLSAYLFDSLSPEGRLEVEKQLKENEACRRELEELKVTLDLVSGALGENPEDNAAYAFEEARMERVLAATRQAPILRLPTGKKTYAAAAAILLFVSLTVSYLGTRHADEMDSIALSGNFGLDSTNDDSATMEGESRSWMALTGERASTALPGRQGAVRDGSSMDRTQESFYSRSRDSRKEAPKAESARSIPPTTSAIITDAAGIGGGAAGAYPKRYALGRSETQKPRFGGSSPAPTSPPSLATIEPAANEKFLGQVTQQESKPKADTHSARGLDKKTKRSSQQSKRKNLDSARRRPLKEAEIELREEKKEVEGLNKDAFFAGEPNIAKSVAGGKHDTQSKPGPPALDLLEQLGQLEGKTSGSYGSSGNLNLNIEQTDDGYLAIGEAVQSQAQAADGIESPYNSQTAQSDSSIRVNEKTLNSYAYYKNLDQNLSYSQFNSRSLVIPPPAIGDEGLGEKGFRQKYGVNPFVATNRDHLSTFGMDVDNASWGRARENIRNRKLPPPQTIRVEEFVNNFSDERPGNPESVFTLYTEGGPSPFGDHDLELLQVTLKSRDLRPDERKDAILTFAVDTSGSMANAGKLNLLKKSLRTLVSNLEPADRVALVAFSTNAYVVLPHTSLREKEEIYGAIDSLVASGGTNVEAGIDLAYRLAGESSHRRAANRVILCSDGVANLGAKGPGVVLERIRRYAVENLISLYTYAFGTGGKQAVRGDRMLQRLADEGDGRYQYVDSASTSEIIFSLPSQLQTLASDAKIQVDFNPSVVSHYRLLGYEKRDIADADFRNDKVDAGEVGPGSTVTALYEIKRIRPVGSLGRIYLRYMDSVARRVEEFNYELHPGILSSRRDGTSDRFRFIASVAEFAELLRGSYYARNGSYGETLQLMSEVSEQFQKRRDWQEAYRAISSAQSLSAVVTLNSIR